MTNDQDDLAGAVIGILEDLSRRCANNPNHLAILEIWRVAESEGDISLRDEIRELIDLLESGFAGDCSAERQPPGEARNHLSTLGLTPVPKADRDRVRNAKP